MVLHLVVLGRPLEVLAHSCCQAYLAAARHHQALAGLASQELWSLCMIQAK